MTTERNHQAWVIGLAAFAALVVTGVIANAFSTPTAATQPGLIGVSSRVWCAKSGQNSQ